MGQSVAVESNQVDVFCVFTTDRVLTGQDGERFTSAADATEATGFPATLALRLFEGDGEIDHVYVAANDVIVRRSAAWDAAAIDAAESIIGELYRHYE